MWYAYFGPPIKLHAYYTLVFRALCRMREYSLELLQLHMDDFLRWLNGFDAKCPVCDHVDLTVAANLESGLVQLFSSQFGKVMKSDETGATFYHTENRYLLHFMTSCTRCKFEISFRADEVMEAVVEKYGNENDNE